MWTELADHCQMQQVRRVPSVRDKVYRKIGIGIGIGLIALSHKGIAVRFSVNISLHLPLPLPLPLPLSLPLPLRSLTQPPLSPYFCIHHGPVRFPGATSDLRPRASSPLIWSGRVGHAMADKISITICGDGGCGTFMQPSFNLSSAAGTIERP